MILSGAEAEQHMHKRQVATRWRRSASPSLHITAGPRGCDGDRRSRYLHLHAMRCDAGRPPARHPLALAGNGMAPGPRRLLAVRSRRERDRDRDPCRLPRARRRPSVRPSRSSDRHRMATARGLGLAWLSIMSCAVQGPGMWRWGMGVAPGPGPACRRVRPARFRLGDARSALPVTSPGLAHFGQRTYSHHSSTYSTAVVVVVVCRKKT